MKQGKVKAILETKLLHKCDILTHQAVKNSAITKYEFTVAHKDIKCQLSQKTSYPASDKGGVSVYHSEGVLIICDNVTVTPGSMFDVYLELDNEPKRFKCASDPVIYPTHMEIAVIRTGRA